MQYVDIEVGEVSRIPKLAHKMCPGICGPVANHNHYAICANTGWYVHGSIYNHSLPIPINVFIVLGITIN